MKKFLGLIALLSLSSLPASAQGLSRESTPKFEIGGGYAYRSWGSTDIAGFRTSMNGWNANADYNVTNNVGLALDVTATRNGQGGTPQWIYSFLVGPRFYPVGHHKLTPFVHAMAGLGRYTLNIPPSQGGPFSYSENRLAFDFGGGIDASVTDRFAVRVAQVDYERTVFTIFTNPGSQNNFKFSAGIVIHFGEK